MNHLDHVSAIALCPFLAVEHGGERAVLVNDAVNPVGKLAEGTKSIDEEYQTLLNYKKQALEQINQILAMRDEVTSQTIEETNNYVDK